MILQGVVLGFLASQRKIFLLWVLAMLSTVWQVGAQSTEAGEVVTVTASANGFDQRTDEDEGGCAPSGCTAENTRDGDLEDTSRWSCSLELVEEAGGAAGEQCRIVYDFSEPLDVNSVSIAFFNGDERTRTLNIEVNGDQHTAVTSGGITSGFEAFDLNVEGVLSIGLESVGLDGDEVDFLSITEVRVCAYGSRLSAGQAVPNM